MNRALDGHAEMPPDRWQRVQDVLADAIECPACERYALIDARCGSDLSLRREVESLLTAHESTGAVDRLAPLMKPIARLIEPALEYAGRRVAHYRVGGLLGTGGMGVVYRAEDERLGRQVALKFLPPHLGADADAKARFVAEARAAAALDHPNVCTIYEIDETGDGQLFIVMPLYDGETLRARLDRGRLTFDEALPIALQVACGLGHAHECGIVHRDVKPSNIVVLPDGTAKVLDFGIASIGDALPANRRARIGTIAYMSPEQANAGLVDGRSDIWSLGVVIHEMLAGERPFQGDDGQAVVQMILSGDPRLTAMTYPDVPAAIDQVLRRALSKSPEQRYPSMALLAAELSALAVPSTTTSGRSSGTQETPTHIWEAERRRAAVLVTLVSDYAALIDQHSPSEAHEIVARVRDTAVDVVREYGGLVNQAIGDEIVSLFGVPAAHDDDDLRAVRAAMELHARIGATAGSGSLSGVGVSIQSGVHVGPVVARRLHEGPRRFDVVGPATTIAARLAAVAEPGAVLISPEVQRLVGPYMRTAARPPVVIDSHAGAVTPARLVGETGIATRLEASSRTGLTPYVGRHSELSILESRVTAAVNGDGSVIAIVGEPGAGKSRLLHELQEGLKHSNPGVRVLLARCRAYGDGVPYGVFVQILCAALELRAPLTYPDSIVARVRAIDRSLEPFVPLFLHLLSVSDEGHALPRHLKGEHLQSALLDALAALIGVLARQAPLVMLIEDWHWADTGSRAAFVRVSELAASSRLLLIVTCRPEAAAQVDWPAHAVRLRLEQLEFAASAAIVRAALGVDRVADSLARQLHVRAGGNPFFLEQLCAALLEQQGASFRDEDTLVGEDQRTLSLPDTVQGVIRARLDNLGAQALETLRVGSVIGAEIDHALLADVVSPDVDLAQAIQALQVAGLLQPTSVAPTIAYRFTHALTQEVCYDSLVGHQRKVLHGAIGRALALTGGRRADERAAVLAHHFRRAEDWPAAIRFGRLAAERAVALSQFADALATLDSVLECAARLPEAEQAGLTAELMLEQERLCETLGLRARQQEIVDILIKRLARDGSSTRLAEVYLRQGDLSTLLKRFDAADRALSTALRIAQERSDPTLLRRGLRSLGLLRWHEGRHDEALTITERALEADRSCHDELAVAVDLTNLGNILKAKGDYAGAKAVLEEALTIPELLDDPKKLSYTQHNLANVYRALGDLDRALECLVQGDEIARLQLLPIQRSFHLTSIAHIQLQLGEIDRALETYREAVSLSRRARHADGLVQSLRMLGNALIGLGRYAEALPCVQEAARLFAQLEDRVSEAEMWSSAAVILERESPEAAGEAWNIVLGLQHKRGDSKGELDAREGLARTCRASGSADAIPAYKAALALAATIGDRSREAAIRNVLGVLEWERGGYAEALRHYEAALALLRIQGEARNQALVLNSLGVTLTRLGRPEEARTVLEEGLSLGRRLGESQLEAHALAGLGQVALSAHDLRAAIDCFEQSRLLRHATGDRVGEGWMYVRLSALRSEIGDGVGALDARRAALAAAGDAGDERLSQACRAQT